MHTDTAFYKDKFISIIANLHTAATKPLLCFRQIIAIIRRIPSVHNASVVKN